LAKVVVFVLVVGLTYVSERKRSVTRKGRGMVEAGLRGREGGKKGEGEKEGIRNTVLIAHLPFPPPFPPSLPPFLPSSGIMATQSNDFAFGIPICAALYSSTHPEYISLIYLLAPISLVSRLSFPSSLPPSLPPPLPLL